MPETLVPALLITRASNWEEARDLYTRASSPPLSETDPSMAPKQIPTFAALCLDFVTSHLNIKIAKTKYLFNDFLENSNKILQRTQDFKSQLLRNEIDNRLLPLTVARLQTAIPDSVRTLLEDRDFKQIEELHEGLLFLRTLLPNLPSSLLNGWNLSRHRQVKYITSEIATLEELRLRVQTAAIQLRPLASTLDSIPKIYERIIEIDNKRAILAQKLQEMTDTKNFDNLTQVDETFSALYHQFDELEKDAKQIHEEYPGLFAEPFTTLKKEMRATHEHRLALICQKKREREERAEAHLKEVVEETTLETLLSDPHRMLYFLSISHIYEKHHRTMELPHSYLLAHNLERQADAYYKTLERIKHNEFFNLSPQDLFLLQNADPKTLEPIRHLLNTQTPRFIATLSPFGQKKVIQHLLTLLPNCPSLNTPFLASFLQRQLTKLPNFPDIDHQKHKIPMDSELRRYTLLTFHYMIINDRLENMTLNRIYEFRSLHPNYPHFQHLLAEAAKCHYLDIFGKHEEPYKGTKFIKSVEAIVRECPQLDSADLRKHLSLLKKIVFNPPPKDLPYIPEVCYNCINEKIALCRLDELTELEIIRLEHSTPLQEAFERHLNHFFSTMTTTQLRQFRHEQLDPFVFKNPNFAHLPFVATFIQQTNARISAFLTQNSWIFIYFSDLFRTFFTPFDAAIYRNTIPEVTSY